MSPRAAFDGWVAISLLVVLLNYVVFHAMRASESVRMLMVALSVGFAFLFITGEADFLFIAAPITIIYAVAALHVRGLLRRGFLLVVASNVLWILARQLTAAVLGREVPVAYRFDNDAYHIARSFRRS